MQALKEYADEIKINLQLTGSSHKLMSPDILADVMATCSLAKINITSTSDKNIPILVNFATISSHN